MLWEIETYLLYRVFERSLESSINQYSTLSASKNKTLGTINVLRLQSYVYSSDATLGALYRESYTSKILLRRKITTLSKTSRYNSEEKSESLEVTKKTLFQF